MLENIIQKQLFGKHLLDLCDKKGSKILSRIYAKPSFNYYNTKNSKAYDKQTHNWNTICEFSTCSQ